MAHHKTIWWKTKTVILDGGAEQRVPDIQEDGTCACEVHYLIGYCPNTITQFRKMAEELRKTFPQATDNRIECGKIHKSPIVDGHTIICWATVLKFKKYKGWYSQEHGGIDYYW